MRKFLLAVCISGFVLTVRGQSCTQLLNQAEDNYESGRLLAILKDPSNPSQPTFLKCLKEGGLSKEEEIRARKLLTKVYIFTDNEADAEFALIDLLKTDPEHILDPQADPAELFYLMQQFRTLPILRIGVRGGATSLTPNVVRQYSVTDTYTVYNGDTQAGGSLGFFVEALAERKLYKGFDALLGVQYRNSIFNAENINNVTNTVETNRQTYLRVPAGLRYTLWNMDRTKIILPYVFGGASYDFLLNANSEIARTGGVAYTRPSDEVDELIVKRQVNETNYSFYGGAGIKIRFKTHFFTVDARYDTSREYFYKSDNKWGGSKSTTFDATYVSDDITFNYILFSVGYTASIHVPRKLKDYR